jgi:mRNA interferase HigB
MLDAVPTSGEHPDAAGQIAAWYEIVSRVRCTTFVEVRSVFPDADAVDGYVVLNFRFNRYQLVTVIHYAREKNGRPTQGHIYIRSFLTHKEYDDTPTGIRSIPMSTTLADPTEMIRLGAPRVIHNDAELAAYTDALFQLTAKSRRHLTRMKRSTFSHS